ncbi:hypothetical protein [Halapricum desulfuricans]|uniref:Putative membrane protein n=1 Tax=Halapricum desulfuricans TaxID=2841257 RepID=A0A897N8A8_9EURY|nr:hypothetical protein [Halapricum desulfuricans]QSG07415.1 putative membrane protein [Halapricum desulfuricans]
MKRPPFDRRQRIVAVLAVVAVSVGTLAAVQATASQTAPASTGDICEYDTYSPPDLDFGWTQSYKDGLSNGSERDWSGGRIVQVGGNGECSLLVSDGRSESLDETTVNGTSGVVTGTVDLGADGSVRFTAVGSNPKETSNGTVESNETTELAISNPGPDYGTNVSLEAGEQSEERSLSNGRFFQFALRQDNGTARIAVWGLDSSWDGEWDFTADNVTADEDWTLALDGRAFLDGIAVGVAKPDESETPAESPTPGETTSDDGFFGPGDDPDVDGRDTDPDGEQNAVGQIVYGLLLSVGGAVGFRYARPIARLNEEIDAIGSKTDLSEVEPAEWKVLLTKAFAAFFVLFGLVMIGTSLL